MILGSSILDNIPRRWLLALCSLSLVLAALAVQWYTPYPYDTDTAFHAAVGSMLRSHGIIHSFPWTPFSYLADHYADKELLFHLMFAALPAQLSFLTAARIVGTVAGASILLSMYFILVRERVGCAWLWAFLPLVVSSEFFFRFALVRPHLFSIALSLLLLWSLARRKYAAVALLCLLFPWSYVAFWQLPLILLFASEIARMLSGSRICWKGAGAALAGIAAGVALHPYALNLIQFNWVQIYEVLIKNAWGGMTGFDLGAEFLPPTLECWLRRLLWPTLLTLTAAWFAWRRRKEDPLPVAFALAALVFLALMAKSIRFVEYLTPFGIAAFALNARPLLARRYATAAVALVSVGYLLLFNLPNIQILRHRNNDMPPLVGELLQGYVPVGAQVFTPSWKFTGPFMLMLPERRFMVGLDPTFFYRKDPELYQLWFAVSHAAPADTAEIICSRFKARFVLTYNVPEYEAFNARMLSDPRVKKVYVDPLIMLFDLAELPECRQVVDTPITVQ